MNWHKKYIGFLLCSICEILSDLGRIVFSSNIEQKDAINCQLHEVCNSIFHFNPNSILDAILKIRNSEILCIREFRNVAKFQKWTRRSHAPTCCHDLHKSRFRTFISDRIFGHFSSISSDCKVFLNCWMDVSNVLSKTLIIITSSFWIVQVF